ncbi:hypothetical protein [Flavisphingomonas formosensis]|uniref:hypothetical protein n=1 Tax=Flavisphingomonas formosensis TaxID=861534 RepID=UPI001E2FA8AF|nr:hypothetical protein [Sphingomonas formosensis]
MIEALAPAGDEVVEYDRTNLALYAALLEAENAGRDWCDVASSLMHLDVTRPDAEACWRSHLERARWIVGAGLATALVAFNRRATH